MRERAPGHRDSLTLKCMPVDSRLGCIYQEHSDRELSPFTLPLACLGLVLLLDNHANRTNSASPTLFLECMLFLGGSKSCSTSVVVSFHLTTRSVLSAQS